MPIQGFLRPVVINIGHVFPHIDSVQEVTVPVFSCFSTNDLEEEDPGLTSFVLSYWVAGYFTSIVTVHVSVKNGFSWLIYLFCDSC